MERRNFLGLIASAPTLLTIGVPAPAATRAIHLQAFAASHLPHSAILYCDASILPEPYTVYELRTYETAPEHSLLARHGLIPILAFEQSLIFAFSTITDRNSAWGSLIADPDWQTAPAMNVIRLSLYMPINDATAQV